MRLPEKFRVYIWLINTISRSRNGLTLSDINEQWVDTDMSGGLPLPRNTFLRYKSAIEEMFGIFIECDAHSGYRYYIGNEHVLREDSIQNWLLSTLTVGNLLSEGIAMQNRILLEHTCIDSSMLELLMKAMRQNLTIMLDYSPYQIADIHHYSVEPYCLKLFRQRWYLLTRLRNGQYRIFALDRIKRLNVTGTHFVIDPYFDADDFFSESYGVVIGDGSEVQRIVVRAYGREQYAMRDLPIHHTQRIIAERHDADGCNAAGQLGAGGQHLTLDSDYTDFELTVRPTADLQAHILSRGRWLRVLSPQWLADEIHRQHAEAL